MRLTTKPLKLKGKVVPRMGIEPMTSALPRTIEAHENLGENRSLGVFPRVYSPAFLQAASMLAACWVVFVWAYRRTMAGVFHPPRLISAPRSRFA